MMDKLFWAALGAGAAYWWIKRRCPCSKHEATTTTTAAAPSSSSSAGAVTTTTAAGAELWLEASAPAPSSIDPIAGGSCASCTVAAATAVDVSSGAGLSL